MNRPASLVLAVSCATAMCTVPTIGCGRSSSSALEQLESGDPSVRRNATIQLARDKNKDAVEPLIRVMKNDDVEDVRRAAANALGWIGDRRATKALVETLGGSDTVDVRAAALMALQELADPESIPAMIAIWRLDDTNTANGTLQAGVQQVLSTLPELAYARLLESLEDPNWNVRYYAVETLAHIGDKRALEPIGTLRDDPNELVRAAVERALKKLR